MTDLFTAELLRDRGISRTKRPCLIEGCGQRRHALGMCAHHSYRQKRYGDPHEPMRMHYHGQSGTPTHTSWRKMRERCINPASTQWKWYGGRGVTFCERWESFENFLDDMGERPPGRSLDRIDTNGMYEPGNCRWATHQEQIDGQRKTIKLLNGMTLREAAEAAGIKYSLAYARYRRGEEIDQRRSA